MRGVGSLSSHPEGVTGARIEPEPGTREPSASSRTVPTASIVPSGADPFAASSFAAAFRSQRQASSFSAIHLQGDPGTYQVNNLSGSSSQRLYTSDPDTGAPQPTDRVVQGNSQGQWVEVKDAQGSQPAKSTSAASKPYFKPPKGIGGKIANSMHLKPMPRIKEHDPSQRRVVSGTSIPSSSAQGAATGARSSLSAGSVIEAEISNVFNASGEGTPRPHVQPQASSHSSPTASGTRTMGMHQMLEYALARHDMSTPKSAPPAPSSRLHAPHASNPGAASHNGTADVLERAIAQPLEPNNSFGLANREAIPPTRATELLYELELDKPSGNYVRSFLAELGYRIDLVKAGKNTVLKATNPHSGNVFYVHPRASSSLKTSRPAVLIPNASNLLAIINRCPEGRTPPGHLFLINLAP